MPDRAGINDDAGKNGVSTMSVHSAYTLAGNEIAEMFRADLPGMTDSDLAQTLLRMRSPELEIVRSFLEPVVREELHRRKNYLPMTTA